MQVVVTGKILNFIKDFVMQVLK